MSESLSGFTYRAFISYSHRDSGWADWLHKALENWRVPAWLVDRRTAYGLTPPRLTPVFRDREEFSSATDLGLEISTALAQSECLIVICSPEAAASRWVDAEVLAFKRLGRATRIFCLIVDGEPGATEVPGRAGEECLCPALRCRLDATGQLTTERTEPVGADVRHGKDGKADAKLKLIAGMLGIGFDVLKQREQHRHMRRLAAITGLALVVMTVTSLLAVAALFARHDAMIAQQAAERRQKQAEDLVGFMLGDLNDKLEQVQRLDIIQSVNDKAMAYFAALPPTDVGATTLAQRAKALERIGVVRMGLGNLADALEAFHASRRISAQLAGADAGNIARQVAYARTLAFIGTAHWQQNRLAEAQSDFESMLPTLRRLAVGPHADPYLLFHLAMLDHNLGRVLEARGQPGTASRHYRERLVLSQRLAAAEPDDSAYAVNLGEAHSDLARLALQRGDLLTAITEYRANDAIQTRLANADRKDNIQRQNLLEARAILGRTLALAGETGTGTSNLAEAVAIAGQLAKFEPENTEFRVDLAIYSSQLARLKRLAGDQATAGRLTAAAIRILDELTRQDPANREWQKHAAEAMLEQAAQSHAAGRHKATHEQARNALHGLEPILGERPGDRDTLLLTLAARLQLAAATPDKAAADALTQQTLQTLRAIRTDPGDPRLLALQVEAMLMLDGHSQAVQPLVTRLWQSGYRDGWLLDLLERAQIEYPPNPEFRNRLLALNGSMPAASSWQPPQQQRPRPLP